MTRVSIVGTGYVGLVTGACLADLGHDVICIDVDDDKVARINKGEPPIHEDGLPEILQRNIGKRLVATTDLKSAVAESTLTFIAVGTPSADGHIDLRFVEECSAQIGRAIAPKHDYHTIVVKSTVIPGTTDGIVRQTLERESGRTAGGGFGLGMNPEFLTEGTAIQDFTLPDRLVLGGIDERTHSVLTELYSSFGSVPRILTNNTTAEMIKYASNVTLAAMISLANEFGRVCTAMGNVDVVDVMRGVHESAYFTKRHPSGKITAGISSFLEAGCGFGGSCLPKDLQALTAHGQSLGLEMGMLRAIQKVNAEQPGEIMKLIERHFKSLRGVPVTVLGLAFKPDTDDVRESPAFPILQRLKESGAVLTAFDPVVKSVVHPATAGVSLAPTLEEALQKAEIVVLVTRWDEFRDVGAMLHKLGRQPLLVDGRRILQAADFAAYEGIGR